MERSGHSRSMPAPVEPSTRMNLIHSLTLEPDFRLSATAMLKREEKKQERKNTTKEKATLKKTTK